MNLPQKVLAGLLGDQTRLARLSDFLDLPANLAGNEFAYECLFEPKTVTSDPNDPRTSQITEILAHWRSADHLKLLDYGAGKGRLASAIFDAKLCEREKLAQWLDYVAFDSSAKDKPICEDAIARIDGTSENRYFNDDLSLLAVCTAKTIQVIVMCNVLHEIDPSRWLDLFHPQGIVLQLLSDDGFLLLVEDLKIPTGEKAYQNGFLVLDTHQVRILFQIGNKEAGFAQFDARGDGRLKAHLIPKTCLGRTTRETRRSAIENISQAAKGQIRKLREEEGTYARGRKRAFGYTNSQMPSWL